MVSPHTASVAVMGSAPALGVGTGGARWAPEPMDRRKGAGTAGRTEKAAAGSQRHSAAAHKKMCFIITAFYRVGGYVFPSIPYPEEKKSPSHFRTAST